MKRSTPLKTHTPLRTKSPMRRSRTKSTPVRKEARGKPCMVRLPGCTGDTDTVVLAHYRLAGYAGTALKPPDEMGAYACWYCHAVCDGRLARPDGYSFDAVRLAHCEGVFRTQELRRGEA